MPFFSRGPFFRVFAKINIRVDLIFAFLHLIISTLLIVYSKKKFFAGPNFRALVVYREKRENKDHAKKRALTVHEKIYSIIIIIQILI